MKNKITYTIQYSKGGILQYADFRFENNKLVYNSFYPKWAKTEEVPKVDNLTTIDEILTVISNFAFRPAKIYKINGDPIEYYYAKLDDKITNFSNLLNNHTTNITTQFFIEVLLPIFKKKKIKIGFSYMCGKPVLIKFDKKANEYRNTTGEESLLIEYICMVFLNETLDKRIEYRENEVYETIPDAFSYLYSLLDEIKLEKYNIIIK